MYIKGFYAQGESAPRKGVTVLKFVLRVFLGLIITNWIYSEINLFVPKFIPTMQKVLNVVRIPTHDEWPAIAAGAGVPEIDKSIKVAVRSISKTEKNLLSKNIRYKNRERLVKAHWKDIRSSNC